MIATSYKLAIYYHESNLSLIWFGLITWFSRCLSRTPFGVDITSESTKSTAKCHILFQVWNTSTCEFVRTLNGHKRGIACLQYRDRLVVSGSSDNTIRWAAGVFSRRDHYYPTIHCLCTVQTNLQLCYVYYKMFFLSVASHRSKVCPKQRDSTANPFVDVFPSCNSFITR